MVWRKENFEDSRTTCKKEKWKTKKAMDGKDFPKTKPSCEACDGIHAKEEVIGKKEQGNSRNAK